MTKKRPQSVETPKNEKCSYFKLVTETIVPTSEPGVLRHDESNHEGLVSELESRNSKISDGGTLNFELSESRAGIGNNKWIGSFVDHFLCFELKEKLE